MLAGDVDLRYAFVVRIRDVKDNTWQVEALNIVKLRMKCCELKTLPGTGWCAHRAERADDEVVYGRRVLHHR